MLVRRWVRLSFASFRVTIVLPYSAHLSYRAASSFGPFSYVYEVAKAFSAAREQRHRPPLLPPQPTGPLRLDCDLIPGATFTSDLWII